MSDRTKMVGEVESVRQWFSCLSSEGELSAAVAISDVAFISMFVDLINRHHSSGVQELCRRPGDVDDPTDVIDSESSFSIEDISRLYEKHSSVLHSVVLPMREGCTTNSSVGGSVADDGAVASPRVGTSRNDEKLETHESVVKDTVLTCVSHSAEGTDSMGQAECSSPALAQPLTGGTVEDSLPHMENKSVVGDTVGKVCEEKERIMGDGLADIESTAFRISPDLWKRQVVESGTGLSNMTNVSEPESKSADSNSPNEKLELSSAIERPTLDKGNGKEREVERKVAVTTTLHFESGHVVPVMTTTDTTAVVNDESNAEASRFGTGVCRGENNRRAKPLLDTGKVQGKRTCDAEETKKVSLSPSSKKKNKSKENEGIAVAESNTAVSLPLSLRRKEQQDRDLQGDSGSVRGGTLASEPKSKDLIDHVRLVFSSVCEVAHSFPDDLRDCSKESRLLARGDEGNKSVYSESYTGLEFLTLDPVFFHEINGETFSRLADEIYGDSSSSSFLLPICKSAAPINEMSWLERIDQRITSTPATGRNENGKTDDSAASTVPLSAILLARMETAIQDAYHLHLRREGRSLFMHGPSTNITGKGDAKNEQGLKTSSDVKTTSPVSPSGLATYLQSTSHIMKTEHVFKSVMANHPHGLEEEGSSADQWATPPEVEEDHQNNDISSPVNDSKLHGNCQLHLPREVHNESTLQLPYGMPSLSLCPEVLIGKAVGDIDASHDRWGCHSKLDVNLTLPRMLSLQKDLHGTLKEMGNSVAAGLLEPVMKLLQPENDPSFYTSPGNLVFTPLVWYVQSANSKIEKDNRALGGESVGMYALSRSWNVALKEVLKGVLDLSFSSTGKGKHDLPVGDRSMQPQERKSDGPLGTAAPLPDKHSKCASAIENSLEQVNLGGGGKVANDAVNVNESTKPQLNPVTAQSSTCSSKKNKKKKKKKRRKASASVSSTASKHNHVPNNQDDSILNGSVEAATTEAVGVVEEITVDKSDLREDESQVVRSTAVEMSLSSSLDSDLASAMKDGDVALAEKVPLTGQMDVPPTRKSTSIAASGITVSRMGGDGTTCVVVESSNQTPPATSTSSTPSVGGSKQNSESSAQHGQEAAVADEHENSAEWETVESKGRGGKSRKTTDHHQRYGRFSSFHGTSRSHGNSPNQKGTSSDGGSNSSRKTKSGRSQASRKRTANRKTVREILSSILDAVDEEVVRRRKAATKALHEERKRIKEEKKRAANASRLAAQAEQKRVAAANSWRFNSGNKQQVMALDNRAASLRDVVKGTTNTLGAKTLSSSSLPNVVGTEKPMSSLSPSRTKLSPAMVSSLVTGGSAPGKAPSASSDAQTIGDGAKFAAVAKYKSKRQVAPPQNLPPTADQSTAPTLPETLSGVSAENGISTEFNAIRPLPAEPAVINDSSSGETEKQSKQTPYEPSNQNEEQESSPAPPLPTLLSPVTANSASSSVASSLEAPRTTRHHHHSSSSKENDVGYHLLDVCDRLSNDMNVFMGRRAVALSIRRRERGTLLASLQDMVTNIWAGRCHVEMYGSCATQLDLPSSDLDVVICGLDNGTDSDGMRQGLHTSSTGKAHKNKTKKVPQKQELSHAHDSDKSTGTDEPQQPQATPSTAQQPNIQHAATNVPYHHHHFSFQSPNAGRVLRLAAELERQAWAVQVKAIPTATVPVIKILADPARLPGASAAVASGGDWMLQQQHMAAHAAAAAAAGTPPPPPAHESTPSQGSYYPSSHPVAATAHHATMGLPIPSQSPYHNPHTPPPWRGADVMNGLLSVDITFEGPEHGGVGSTAFSARVVQDACNETGLPPESTPAVQVTMVLKELLAQRRLNEPFSGGLSSYAVLLLVVAVMRERRAIRDEMERIERHRRSVAAGGGNSTGNVSTMTATNSRPSPKGNNGRPNTEEVIKQADKGVAWPAPQHQKQHRAQHEQASAPQASTTVPMKPAPTAPHHEREDNAEKQQHSGNNSVSTSSGTCFEPTEADSTVPAPATASSSKSTKSSWASIAKKQSAIHSDRRAMTPSVQSVTDTPKDAEGPQAPRQKQQQSQHKKAGEAVITANETTESISQGVKGSQAVSYVCEDTGPKLNAHNSSSAVPSSAMSGGAVASEREPAFSSKAKGKSEDSESIADSGAAPVLHRPDRNGNSLPSSSHASDSGLDGQSLFPQGSNDVLEVLCSGEPTAGKLLMHFLLFYGQHFDAQSTCIDVGGKHHPDYQANSSRHLSPFITRKAGGTIDPITGMFTVDPIVVYDPLEGAENNNVTRSCFAWSSIRWVFAQCYMTLSSVVERSDTSPPASSSGASLATVQGVERNSSSRAEEGPPTAGLDGHRHNAVDAVSPLLELLLSF